MGVSCKRGDKTGTTRIRDLLENTEPRKPNGILKKRWGDNWRAFTQTQAARTNSWKGNEDVNRAEEPKHSCSTAVKGKEAAGVINPAGSCRTRCFFLLWL